MLIDLRENRYDRQVSDRRAAVRTRSNVIETVGPVGALRALAMVVILKPNKLNFVPPSGKTIDVGREGDKHRVESAASRLFREENEFEARSAETKTRLNGKLIT